jgi:hypothetical protein
MSYLPLIELIETAAQSRLRLAAAEWITANPKAFALFEEMALEEMQFGKFGVKYLAEICRWKVRRTWPKSAEFKINNVLVSYLARELVARHPELEPFIEFRKCRDEREGAPEFTVTRRAA